VKRKQAELALRSGTAAPGADLKPGVAESGSEGDKRLKTEGGWAATPVKAEPLKQDELKREVCRLPPQSITCMKTNKTLPHPLLVAADHVVKQFGPAATLHLYAASLLSVGGVLILSS
jgi:hypothetical protein